MTKYRTSSSLFWCGYGLTTLCAMACTPAPEQVTSNVILGHGGTAGSGGGEAGTAGAGGAAGAGGTGGTAGSGGASSTPTIEPTWIRMLPLLSRVDMAVDSSEQLLITANVVNPDGGTLAGFPLEYGAAFVTKLDPEGQPLWLRSFAKYRIARAIAMGPDDRALVLSTSTTPPKIVIGSPPPRYDRFFLTALASDGSVLWEQSFGGNQATNIRLAISDADIVVDAQGNTTVATSAVGTLETPIGTFKMLTGEDDVFFIQIDSNGNFLQVKHLPAPGTQYVRSIALDHAGQIVVAGTLAESASVAKFDATLAPVWTKKFLDTGTILPMRVAIGAGDDIVLAGTFHGTVDFGAGPLSTDKVYTSFLAHFDSMGNHESNRVFLDEPLGTNPGVRLAAGASGQHAFSTDVFAAVDLGGGMIFNNDSGPNGTSHDAAMARYSADGSYLSGASAGGPKYQYTAALAFSPQGRLYWAVSYAWSLRYGDKMLVEPAPDDVWPEGPTGTALFALPP